MSNDRLCAQEDPRCEGWYPVSLSSRTIVYKGLLLATQLGDYFDDLRDERVEIAVALVHQRFSTNTFPSWQLAHPYRMVAHNGEINTLRGNVNWMAARQASVASPLFGDDIEKLWPISYEGQSDTACFDNALEFLVQGGYSLAHAMMMLIPEAWAGNPLMSEERRAFYEYHAALMEPWDGPAAVAFTDGRQIGATLDRNGLRPARYLVTDDGLVVMASEMGVLPIPEEKIITKWRLQPGRMLLVDLEQGRIISDDEIKTTLAQSHPYKRMAEAHPDRARRPEAGRGRARRARTCRCSTASRRSATRQEDTRHPDGADGGDWAGGDRLDGHRHADFGHVVAARKRCYTYFKQNFAQVTNPPIDPIREELVMSLVSFIGPRPNILDHEGTAKKKRLEVRQPILTNVDLEKIRSIGHFEDSFDTKTLDFTYDAALGADGMQAMVTRLCDRAEQAVVGGYNIIVLSDRMVGPDRIPIPALLATAAVHHHLIRKGLRTSVGLVVETGEAREVHHFALARRLWRRGDQSLSRLRDAGRNGRRIPRRSGWLRGGQALHQVDRQGPAQGHVENGHLDLSVLLRRADLRRHRPVEGTSSTPISPARPRRSSGVGLEEIAARDGGAPPARLRRCAGLSLRRSMSAANTPIRIRGEAHNWTPDTVALLQHAVRGNIEDKYARLRQAAQRPGRAAC